MKKILISLGVIFSLSAQSFAFFGFGDDEVFSDLSESSENFDAIKYVKEEGIVEGYDDGTFKEGSKINRAEFLKIILEAKESFDIENAKSCLADSSVEPFSDVDASQWFAPYTCFAKKEGIIEGYEDGSFKPSQEINLPEMAKIISLTQDLSTREKDESEDWYLPYLEVLSEKNAIPSSVSTVGHLMTRGEMAEVVYRVKKNISDKKSATISELIAKAETIGDFGEIGSCQILGEVMKIGEYSQPVLYRGVGIMEDVEEADFATDEGEATSVEKSVSNTAGASSDDYSKTNVQVEGVDEADIVKNDGKYIYLVKGNELRIVDAFPSSSMKEIAKIQFKDKNFNPQELFLSENKLIVIGSSREEGVSTFEESGSLEKIWYPHWWGVSFTKVIAFDISDRSNPEVFRETSFEGNYSKSRRIGDRVYLVINKYPDFHYYRTGVSENNLIPRFKDSFDTDGEESALVECGDVRFFPGFETPNFLTVASINIEDKNEKIGKKVLLGSSDNIYMSKNALYIATGVRNPEKGYWSWDNTKVYKFGLNQGKIDFSATGKVEGRILNQFSMDEFDGNFRIATTTDRDWREGGSNQESKLFVLNPEMDTIGKIEGIAPGERIKSVRFMGDKAYMVTFETMDPFFVIDLSNAESPKILGELKIPGWSDYLHPYDEDHLIGFGRETKEDTGADGRFTREDTLGMKISVFDVTDLENPKEKFKYIIGDRGTESELLRDHKALLFDKEKDLLAFPIHIKEEFDIEEKNCYEYVYSNCPTVCQKRCTETSPGANDCDGPGSCVFKKSYNNIRTSFAGAMVLNIDLEDGISERGRMSNYTENDYKNKEYFYEPWEMKIRRIIYIGENLYSVSQNFIKSADIETVEESGSLELK